MPDSLAPAHALKTAKRSQFSKAPPQNRCLIAIATGNSEVRIYRFPDFNRELTRTIWHNVTNMSLRCLAILSARGSVQLPGFRYIGTPAHVVDIPFRSSSIAKSESIVGVKSNRLVVISDGSFVVTFIHVSVTPVLEGEGAFGIEPNCRVKIGDGSIIVAFVCIYDASVPKGVGALGFESNRLVKIGKRSVVSAFARIDDASVAKR